MCSEFDILCKDMAGLTVQNREMLQNVVPKEAIINGELVSELELILSRLYYLYSALFCQPPTAEGPVSHNEQPSERRLTPESSKLCLSTLWSWENTICFSLEENPRQQFESNMKRQSLVFTRLIRLCSVVTFGSFQTDLSVTTGFQSFPTSDVCVSLCLCIYDVPTEVCRPVCASLHVV